MNLKLIEKATVTLEEIKKLDKDIIAIDALAIALVSGEIKTSFSIQGEKKKEDRVCRIDEDGDLKMGTGENQSKSIERMLFGGLSGLIHYPERVQESKPDYQLQFDLTEETTLQLLGVLLGDKQRKRESLIVQLKNLGFTL